MKNLLTLLPALIFVGIGVYFLYPVLLSFMGLGVFFIVLCFVIFVPVYILIKVFRFNPDNEKHSKIAQDIFVYSIGVGMYFGIVYFIFSWIRVLF